MGLRRRLCACACFANTASAFTGTVAYDKHVLAHAGVAAATGLQSRHASPAGVLQQPPANGRSMVRPRAAVAVPTGASSYQNATETLSAFDAFNAGSWSSGEYTEDYSTEYEYSDTEPGGDYGESFLAWPRPAVFPQQPQPTNRAGPLVAYMDALERRPLLTKAATSGIVCAVGDIVAQALSFYSRGAGAADVAGSFLGSFQVYRLAVYGFLGAAYLAPVVHVWFGMLEQIMARVAHPRPARWGRWVGDVVEVGGGQADADAAVAAAAAVVRGDANPTFRGRMSKAAQMTFVDQLVGAPLVNAGFIFGFAFLSAGGFGPLAARSAAERVSSTLAPTLMACWRVWPVVNLINFAFVPPSLRLLFVNCVGLFWNVFMSILMSK